MNFLEQLVAEWYGYTGHFVRTNVKIEKRAKGGWGGEIDVLAYLPERRNVSHIETSMDANSWSERKKRFAKKFSIPRSVYARLFPDGFSYLERIVVVGLARVQDPGILGSDIHVYSVPTMVRLIVEGIAAKHPATAAVPETYPLLRALQFGAAFGEVDRPLGLKKPIAARDKSFS